MPYLIQLLLPNSTDAKEAHTQLLRAVREELTAKFGGVTAYSRASAEGLWEARPGVVERDEMVLFEVMAKSLKKRWWRRYRCKLEAQFAQSEIVVRALKISRL